MANSYEQDLIQSIQKGNLERVKSLWIGKNDINRPFLKNEEIPVVNKSNTYPFPYIKHPTIVIYTILCEQPDILLYLLQNKKPDLSIYVNGWAAIHYAACTKDYECMKILLKFQNIQENIDFPVIEPIKVNEGHTTTALHIATTNRRHAQVILLTQPLPQIEYDGNFTKIPDGSEIFTYKPANVLQKSAFGNYPIHIAVRQNDWDLCQILLSISDDLSLKNDKGQTPIDIAVQFKKHEIKQKLETNLNIQIDEIRSKYIISTRKKTFVQQEDSISTQETEENSEQLESLQKTIGNMNQTIHTMSYKVAELEQKTQMPKNKSVIKSFDFKPCCNCGSLETNQCSKCGSFYCKECFNSASHSCNNS